MSVLVELDLGQIDDNDLLEEIVYRGIGPEEIDAAFDSWEVTRRMRDYFVAEMAKIEVPV